MKKNFRISFYIMFFGWILFMFFMLFSYFLNILILNKILFMLGFIFCIIGFISFHLINTDDNFFKTQDKLIEEIKELKAEKYKTEYLNKVLIEKIKEYEVR